MPTQSRGRCRGEPREKSRFLRGHGAESGRGAPGTSRAPRLLDHARQAVDSRIRMEARNTGPDWPRKRERSDRPRSTERLLASPCRESRGQSRGRQSRGRQSRRPQRERPAARAPVRARPRAEVRGSWLGLADPALGPSRKLLFARPRVRIAGCSRLQGREMSQCGCRLTGW